jgi:CRISPR-associated protein Csd1
MILNALCDYYDILSRNAAAQIAPPGYSSAKIHYAIILNDDGSIFSTPDLTIPSSDGKKELPQPLIVPEQRTRSGKNPPPYFLSDKTEYLTDEAKFTVFKEYNLNILEGVHNAEAEAFRNFLNRGWLQPDTLPEGNFVFMTADSGGYIHENPEIRAAWEAFRQNQDEEEVVVGQCLITGEKTVLERLHPKIKNVRNAQSAGANIVSFNLDAFESYGKKQSFNAPVGKTAAFKYGAVLNYLLQNDKQKIHLGDSTVIFWAESSSKGYYELLNFLIEPPAQSEEKRNAEEKAQGIVREQLIKNVLHSVRRGSKLNIDNEELDPETPSYILALAPNNARISIRFFYRDTFGGLIKHIGQHYADMAITGERLPYIPLWLLLKETVPAGSKEPASSPLLAGKILSAILSGRSYPPNLFTTIIGRIRADREVNSVRAAIIKACLIRKYRLINHKLKEEFSVSLNEELKEPAYLLGRLFAVLEQAQWQAQGDVNSSIKERFFASAAASPKRIFPQLLKNTQNHLAKMEKSAWIDKQIGKILADISDFPVQLKLDDQGLFILGYYHQRQTFFTKNNENEEI